MRTTMCNMCGCLYDHETGEGHAPACVWPGPRRELDRRVADGYIVTMYWTRPERRVQILVEDVRRHRGLCFSVDGRDAADAFRHPFAYAG